MFGLTGFLVGKGFTQGFASVIGTLLPLLALAGAVWWLRHDAYQDAVTDTNTAWEKAMARADEKADEIAEEVGVEADQRAEDWADQVKREKEKLDEAAENGTDPFDILFPGQ